MTPIAKQPQILTHAPLEGVKWMGLEEISVNNEISLATCFNASVKSNGKQMPSGVSKYLSYWELDTESNAQQGPHWVITMKQKQALINLALSDYEYCRLAFADLTYLVG